MRSRVVRVSVLLLLAAAAVAVAGVGLFSVLKFLNVSAEVIYGFAFVFFFGMFFVAGHYAYPAIFKNRGGQGVRFQSRAAAPTKHPVGAAIVSAERVGSDRRSSAAVNSTVVITGGKVANGAAVSHPSAGRVSRRATGTLKVVPLQSNLSHAKVRESQGANEVQHVDLHEQRLRIGRMAEASRKRIDLLESKMIRQLHRITANGINNLMLAKRVLSALEKRIDDVDAAIASAGGENRENLEMAKRILSQDLMLADDTMSSVIGAKAVPPIRFVNVESTLNDLIAKIAARRELAGAAA